MIVSFLSGSDDDMISLASMMSVSQLSTIGFLEDDEDGVWYVVLLPSLRLWFNTDGVSVSCC